MHSSSCTALLFLVAFACLASVWSDGGPSLQAQVGNLLGLRGGSDSKKSVRKEDFPQFMMDAYNCMHSDGFGNCLPVYHRKEVNLLRTFFGTVNASPSKAVRAHNSKRLKNSAEITFNVSLLNRELQTVHYSMLRLYKHSLNKEQMSIIKDKCGNGLGGHINLKLYTRHGQTSDGIPRYSLCSAQSMTMAKLSRADWIEFRNLTHMFKSLVNVSANTSAPSKLVSMRLSVQCPSVHPEDLGFTFTSPRERPQLVEFTENDMQKEMIFPKAMRLLAASQLQQERRSKRDTSAEKAPEPTEVPGTSPPSTDAPVAEVQMLPTLPTDHATRKCALYHYEIVFQETSWGSSIISPVKYNANICAGFCYDHPDSNIENHHAYLQSAAHRLMPDTVPPPCCVPKPDKLEPITLLTQTDSEATLQEFEDMIATACECL